MPAVCRSSYGMARRDCFRLTYSEGRGLENIVQAGGVLAGWKGDMEYEAVIGLETHVQLKTKSKMWCGCANQSGAEPNTHVCPVCLGLPGVLPVPNEEALRLTVLTGYLLNCEIPRFAKFDRKSYFYPDMPKNYQITQYDRPSTTNGYVEFEFAGAGSTNGLSRVRIARAHLEK